MIVSEGLCFEYNPTREEPDRALKNIDIEINRGEFVAILGRNGSGKSTLARHLNALLLPTEGTLWISGLDTREAGNVWKVRKTTGMVFQNPDSQLIATVVEEDVAFGPENLGVVSSEIRERVYAALSDVEMSEYAKTAPQFLSGGQKQRIAIAGVLAMKPDCIVLDEPTSMLDPSGRREVLETVGRLNRDFGITVILITHYMEEAVLADRVVAMDRGEIKMDGQPREVFKNAGELKKLGLDAPLASALAFELKSLGVEIEGIAMTPEEFLSNRSILNLAAG